MFSIGSELSVFDMEVATPVLRFNHEESCWPDNNVIKITTALRDDALIVGG